MRDTTICTDKPKVVTYEAKQDNVGAIVPLHHKRRCLVVRYIDGTFGWVCGAFSGMPAAAELNAQEI